ncbi:MAG: MerR family transcriptional regulator [Desulfohalobiaceae bacterium]
MEKIPGSGCTGRCAFTTGLQEESMAEELLTIKEIARKLDLPESNIRYYRDRFEDFLPFVGQGRKRRYKPAALQVFSFIVEGLHQNLTSEEIGRRLAREYPRGVVLEQEEEASDPAAGSLSLQSENPVPSLMVSQSRVLERLAEALCAQSSREAELDRLRAGQAELRRGLALLWKGYRKYKPLVQEAGHFEPGGVTESIRGLEAGFEALKEELESRSRVQEERIVALEQRFVDLHAVLERVVEGLSLHMGLADAGTAEPEREE